MGWLGNTSDKQIRVKVHLDSVELFGLPDLLLFRWLWICSTQPMHSPLLLTSECKNKASYKTLDSSHSKLWMYDIWWKISYYKRTEFTMQDKEMKLQSCFLSLILPVRQERRSRGDKDKRRCGSYFCVCSLYSLEDACGHMCKCPCELIQGRFNTKKYVKAL